jgi:hypothetical protein
MKPIIEIYSDKDRNQFFVDTPERVEGSGSLRGVYAYVPLI